MKVKMRDTSHRREQIIRMLKELGSVQVSHLTSKYQVSPVTIRKDLRFLEQQGIATRSYGGALLKKNILIDTEITIDHKQTLYSEEKMSIGKMAASMINEGESIILDSGSTTVQVAAHLQNKQNLTIVTNGLNVANELSSNEEVNVILLGGTLRRKNMSFFGSCAENTLKDLHVDKVFLGVDGFHMERGITTHFESEAILNRIMCQVATEVIVVTDSSKFDLICLHKILEPSAVTKVITDQNIPSIYLEGLRRLGIEVILVTV
ncbi:transcriptional regulator [Shewanella frigidimarina]|uniref:Transcriptional regulator n=3 Tax=Shewanella TaxID=22 RepID=A0A106BXW5_SHEFR|nr:transcriptional regulator [Shewanella frigidimarina]